MYPDLRMRTMCEPLVMPSIRKPPDASVCVAGGALSIEMNAPTTGAVAAVTTLPDTDPDDCAASGTASSEFTVDAAMKPAMGAMRFKSK